MKTRRSNILLGTAAVLAALAVNSCGSDSLNEGFDNDIDLSSSTNTQETAPSKDSALAQLELDLSDGPGPDPLGGIKDFEDPNAWDTKHIELDEYYKLIENHQYLDSRDVQNYTAPNGVVKVGDEWQVFMDSFTAFAGGEMSFATFGFKGLEHNKKHIGFIKPFGHGDFDPGEGYYIAFSDFETGGWKIEGPYTHFGEFIQISLPHSVSPEGYSYVTFITAGDCDFSLDAFEVASGNPHV